MARKKLILVASDSMDSNKKETRNENGLVRMSKTVRSNMGFDEDKVELYPVGTNGSERVKQALLLDVYQAFSKDIKKLKSGGMEAEELRRVGFVTAKTFRRITGKNSERDDNIWVSDSVEEVVFGCDPEFLLFDRDNDVVVRANNVLGHHGQLGCDGAMAEVRPHPAVTPEELVKNIGDILTNKNLTQPISGYKWVGEVYHRDDARDYPVGGHIHIGNPVQLLKITDARRDNFFKSFNKIIDEFLALPMTRLDGKEKGSTRRTACTMGKYGYFGEWRKCNGRLEHRTLSGRWLIHPSLAKAVLGVAKMIIDEVYLRASDKKFDAEYVYPSKFSRDNPFSNGFDWADVPMVKEIGCTRTSSEMIQILNESEPSKINKTFLDNWKKSLRGLSTYNTYRDYSDALYAILRLPVKDVEKWEKELQKNWLQKGEFAINI